MKIQTLNDVLEHGLKDLYSAENQLVDTLPKMQAVASSPSLAEGFEQHLKQTKEHVRRIEQVAESLDIELGGTVCRGMRGLIEENEEILKNNDPSNSVDAALIAGARKVEHYEIVGYEDLINLMKNLGYEEEASTLEETLNDEIEADEKLMDICESEIEYADVEDEDEA